MSNNKIIDITDCYPKRFINWFESQDELTAEQELELDSWYDDMSPEKSKLLDAFQAQIDFDSSQGDRKVYFQTPVK